MREQENPKGPLENEEIVTFGEGLQELKVDSRAFNEERLFNSRSALWELERRAAVIVRVDELSSLKRILICNVIDERVLKAAHAVKAHCGWLFGHLPVNERKREFETGA